MADEGLSVSIIDPDNSVRIDPTTGTVERDTADGGVIVNLDSYRPDDEDENGFYENLVDKIDGSKLNSIAVDLYEQINADWTSAANYRQNLAEGLKYMGFELREPRANASGDTSAAVEGQSVVTNPLLANACLKSWANAQAELLPSEGPVKVKINAETEGTDQTTLADALERDFNYYLMETATEYYPDTSHMLLWGPIFAGSGFKKVYRCPMRRRPVSESVPSEDLIVSNTQKDLRSCSRITHQILMRPSVMKRMQLLGAYRRMPIAQQPAPEVTPVTQGISSIQGTLPNQQRPEDQPYTIWETQCELDLDEFAPTGFKGEGIPLPYRVTLEKDSKTVLAIHRDWVEDDDQCERKRLYVKYPYVPGPGFYGTGLLHILGNSSAAMTAAWREALDCGMFASFPAFLIAKIGGRQNTSDFRVSAGTGVPVETGDRPIGQIVANLPYHDVTPGLMGMIDRITTQSKEAGAAAESQVSEGLQNVPVGTMLAQIEQATKLMAAAHKGMHQAQSEEFQLLRELFVENPEDFWKGNKICPQDFWDEQKFLAAINDCTLVPKADPNTPSHIHRVAKAVAISQLFSIPQFAQILNPTEALSRILRVIREDPTGLVVDQQPQQGPDPQTIAAMAKLQQVEASRAKVQQQAASDAAKIAAQKDIETVRLAREMIVHQGDAALEQRRMMHEANQSSIDRAHEAVQNVLDRQHEAGQSALDRQADILNKPQGTP